MNLRFETKRIRIRLSPSEWKSLQNENRFIQSFSLGAENFLVLELILSEASSFDFRELKMAIGIDRHALREPVRKKDPHWEFLVPSGPQLSLEIDIFPGKEGA